MQFIEEIKTSEMIQGRWNVRTAKPYPSFCVDESMNLIVGKQPSVVATMIDEFLRLSSIEVEFDEVRAEAHCRTVDYVQFFITLYTDPSSEQNTHIDVVKMDGSRHSFRKYKKDLINAMKGISMKDAMTVSKTSPRKFNMPSHLMASYIPPTKRELENIIIRAGERLLSRDRSVLLFILQNLATMTKPNPSSPQTSALLCELIMENKFQLWDQILMIYTAQLIDMKNDEICGQIMNACLRIISNVLSYTVSNDNGSTLLNNETVLIEHFIPLLIDTVAHVKKIHNVCLAMTCISILVENSSSARTILKEVDHFSQVMEQAKDYGCRESLKLEQTATSTIQTFRNYVIM